MREARCSVRERERERERQTDRQRERYRESERDGSDVTIVTLKWGPCAYVIVYGNLQPSQSFLDTAGWQAKMASIELWIQ